MDLLDIDELQVKEDEAMERYEEIIKIENKVLAEVVDNGEAE
ncbi:MAG: hypothetical protein Q8S84_07205 [bacterium]|nr:hypothetical protein [bacterium]MDP3381244.1 hypothetical protein [bacterium]